jgi:putative toxin-antitoxin system antitoxin component (TIGR02293 family)
LSASSSARACRPCPPQAHAPRRARATYKRRHRLKLVESEKTERLARVIALAEMLWDDDEAAKRFLATPHAELGRRKPIEAALTELGARQVEDVVMRALYGLPA